MGTVAASGDLRELARDLAIASGTDFEHQAALLVSQTAQKIQSIAAAKAPVKTGKLQASIKIHYRSPLSVVIGPDVFYGVYQEFGTGTRGEFPGAMYEIKPKKPGGYLVFKIDGKTVFTKKVKHPGIKARPYMRPAFEQALGQFFDQLVEKGQAQILRGPQA